MYVHDGEVYEPLRALRGCAMPDRAGRLLEIMRLRCQEEGEEVKTGPGGRVFGVERGPREEKAQPGSFM